MTNLSSASKTAISSSNRRLVFLHEWWLIKVEKDFKLGIGGYVNRGTLGSRGMRFLGSASAGKRYHLDTPTNGTQVFASAAIAKRLDNNALEAEDGIIITISGCINRSRTLSYGFSAEVCDCFVSGFPFKWEEYASESSFEKCKNTNNRSLHFFEKCKNTKHRSLPTSFDDLPVTQVRDILLSTNGESEACAFTRIILRDIMKQCGESDSSVDRKQKDGVSLLNPSQKIIEEAHKIDKISGDLHDKDMESCEETEDDYSKQWNHGSNLRRYSPRRATQTEKRRSKRSKRD